jgi:hypothetical protein
MADQMAFLVAVAAYSDWVEPNHAYAMSLGHQHHAGT